MLRDTDKKPEGSDNCDAWLPLPDDCLCQTCGGLKKEHPAVVAALKARGLQGLVGMCDCDGRRRLTWQERLLRYASLPNPDSPKTFDSFIPRKGAESALAAAREFAESEEPPHTLMLVGVTGSGKSHLLEAIGRRCLQRGKLVKYQFVPDLLERLRESYHFEEEGRADVLDYAERPDLLILDDLGSDKVSEWVAERMTMLIDGRQRGNRRLAVGTNLTEEQVRMMYGARLASRLWDRRGGVKLVVLTCGDYRLERQEES